MQSGWRVGVHHNPTPGPADGEFFYGHTWVTLCLLSSHPLWGVIALPLLSYIACWILNQWMYTLVELVSWDASKEELTNRCERPWDNPLRRPSHAGKRRTIALQMLTNRLFWRGCPNDLSLGKHVTQSLT